MNRNPIVLAGPDDLAREVGYVFPADIGASPERLLNARSLVPRLSRVMSWDARRLPNEHRTVVTGLKTASRALLQYHTVETARMKKRPNIVMTVCWDAMTPGVSSIQKLTAPYPGQMWMLHSITTPPGYSGAGDVRLVKLEIGGIDFIHNDKSTVESGTNGNPVAATRGADPATFAHDAQGTFLIAPWTGTLFTSDATHRFQVAYIGATTKHFTLNVQVKASPCGESWKNTTSDFRSFLGGMRSLLRPIPRTR